MHKYKYTAVDLNKKKITGHFLAEDENDLRVQLYKQNLYLVSYKLESDKGPNPFFTVSGTVSIVELTNFCHQFSIMINAGISIIDSLSALSQQKFSDYFQKILQTIYEDVKTGVLLSDAMKKYPKVFPNFFINMVYVGEVSGSLDIVLNNLAEYYENDSATRKKVKNALSYPMMLLALTVVLVALMMFYVMPMFNDALSNMDVDMPGVSAALFSASEYLLANWQTLVLGILAVVFIGYLLFKMESVKFYWDAFKMKCPGLKAMTINVLSARFGRSMGLLLSRGMDLIDALEVMVKLVDNRYAEKQFRIAMEQVHNGATLSEAFGDKGIFHNVMLQMVQTGERSGSLDTVLSSTCKFFDSEVEYAINRLTGMLQPIVLAIMGGSVGTMFYAMYAPMIAIMQQML